MADDDNAGTDASDSDAKLVFVKKTGQFARHDEPGSTFVSKTLQESKDDSREQE